MNQVHTTTHPESQPVLARLLHREHYSLASYLLYAPPWVPPGREHAWKEVRRIAEAQRESALRIGRLLVRRHGHAEPGLFPVDFTRHNYVSLDYLVLRLIEHQRSLIADFERALGELDRDDEARRLVHTILESERKHLDALLTLVPAPDLAQRQAA